MGQSVKVVVEVNSGGQSRERKFKKASCSQPSCCLLSLSNHGGGHGQLTALVCSAVSASGTSSPYRCHLSYWLQLPRMPVYVFPYSILLIQDHTAVDPRVPKALLPPACGTQEGPSGQRVFLAAPTP